jgi:nicotinate-nucleotide pyrophosphorylase (carboxylating)
VSGWLQPEPANWWQIVEDAYHEDIGSGDVTSGCIDPERQVEWYIEAQAEGILCGVGIAEHLLAPFPGDPEDAYIEVGAFDGDTIRRGDHVLRGRLSARRALAVERTALNFIMHLSGVSSLTHQFVQKVEGTGARIVDTRKTIPGLRSLQKYAVRCGGGHNHRMGLFDGAMIKDNHILAVGSITKAVERVRSYASHMTKIEVECENLKQVEEAVNAGAEVILLDNMDPFMMRDAVKAFKGRAILEASGGISLETVKGVAQTGVDLISVGALTHSAVSLPFHMEISS